VTFRGYASTTGDEYFCRDWLGEYEESIDPGTFSRALKKQVGANIPLLLNHDPNFVLANFSSGTMKLDEDERGLHVMAQLDTRQSYTNDLVLAMRRGDVSKMSFSFRANDDKWNASYTKRTVTDLDLFDTSIVTYPANPNTSVDVDNRDDSLASQARLYALVAWAENEERAGRTISAANMARVKAARKMLKKAGKHLEKLTKAGSTNPPLTGGDAGLDGDKGSPTGNGAAGMGDEDGLGPRSAQVDTGRHQRELELLRLRLRLPAASPRSARPVMSRQRHTS
jgi:HK97 family phage prohead protease